MSEFYDSNMSEEKKMNSTEESSVKPNRRVRQNTSSTTRTSSSTNSARDSRQGTSPSSHSPNKEKQSQKKKPNIIIVVLGTIFYLFHALVSTIGSFFSNLIARLSGSPMPSKKRKSKSKLSSIMTPSNLLIAVLACVALVSFVMLSRYIVRSIQTSRVNRSLSELHSSLDNSTPEIYHPTETPQIHETPEPTDISYAEISIENPDSESAQSEENGFTADVTPTPQPLVKSTKFHQIGGDALPAMASLYNENRDLVGWLNIPNVIDLPVMYKDNVYYLTRDFYRQKNTAGTLFLDENHPFKEKTQNLLLHGHNMKDGTMFGRLTQYQANINYLKSNCFLSYSSLWEKEEYVIFAVLHVSLDPKSSAYFNYFTHSTFPTDESFSAYVTDCMLRSLYAIPIDVKPSDSLLTLSTCIGEDRLVIIARRIRDGESTQHLHQIVSTATTQ